MQKVIRRTALASNQAKRKAQIEAAKENRRTWMETFRERKLKEKLVRQQAAVERKVRREDWLLGPLAPRRDIGAGHGVYGAISSQLMQPPKVHAPDRAKFINIAPGDRVCILRGRERGRIGKVYNVDAETESLVVEGMNMHDVEFPEFALDGDNDKRPYRAYPLPYKISDVRLVVPLEDPLSGAVKDVVVDHVHGGEPFLERPYGTSIPRNTRYISGINAEIPWPEPETPEFKDEALDTLRIEVETKTHLPTLQSYPMPATLIDELRNKYSSFRTRHDPEWVAKKERQDALDSYLKRRKLLMPQTELLEKKAEVKAKQRQPLQDEAGNVEMSDDTTRFIQAFMASKRRVQAVAPS